MESLDQTEEKVDLSTLAKVAHDMINCRSFDTDNYGQIVLYMGVYLWSDGTIHTTEEKK